MFIAKAKSEDLSILSKIDSKVIGSEDRKNRIEQFILNDQSGLIENLDDGDPELVYFKQIR